MLIPAYIFAFPGKIIKTFDAPAKHSTGMTFDGKNLWIADQYKDLIYCINPENGHIVKKLKSPAYWITGLTFDGKYLWAIDMKNGTRESENYGAVLYKINPQNGIIEKTVPVSIALPQGLAFDGKYIWIADDGNNQLVQIDQNDGTTIKTIPSPSGRPTGLTFDGKYLWNADHGTNSIYMIDPQTGAVIIFTDSPNEFPRGLAFDGKYLWNVDSQTDKIYKLIKSDNDLFRKRDEKTVELTYRHISTNYGPGNVKTLDIFLAIPRNRLNQQILSIKYGSKPTNFVTDRWGQKTAHFHIENLKQGQHFEANMTVKAKFYDLTFFIYPDKVGKLKQMPDSVKKYLANDAKYDFNNPIIQKAVKNAIGNEQNPYWIVRKIFDYVREHMYYQMSGGWNTAPTVLARGNGSCSEYSFVFISMCRAAGIPARYVGSVVIRSEATAIDDVFHRWVEVYLPNYGWIPVDPSGGDRKTPAQQARFFGHLSPRFLITTQSGGDSKTLQWNYNSNQFFTSEPQTYLQADYYGDWQLVK
jgi:transglutaminase-like putative cysteine protease/streptogramin lyase